MFLIWIEAEVAISVALKGDEKGGAANTLPASDTSWRDMVDIDAFSVIAKDSTFFF